MGWLRFPHDHCDDAETREAYRHEGYLVAYTRNALTGELRKLGYPDDSDPWPVDAIGVACECGWCSEPFATGDACEWMPFCVLAPDDIEDAGRDRWGAHHDDAMFRFRLEHVLPYAGRSFWFTPTSTWALGKPENSEMRDAVVDALIGLRDDVPVLPWARSINDRQAIGASR
jgi:hypothetical protein